MEKLSKLDLLLCRTCVTEHVIKIHEATGLSDTAKRDVKVFEKLNDKLLRMIEEDK